MPLSTNKALVKSFVSFKSICTETYVIQERISSMSIFDTSTFAKDRFIMAVMERRASKQSHSSLILFYYHYRTCCIFYYSRRNTTKQHILDIRSSLCSYDYEINSFGFCIFDYCCLNRHLTINNLLF
jgi:hypothetical protein